MLAALACVDAVVVFDDATPHRLLEALRPNVLVKGGTYAPHEVVGREVVEAYGGEIRVTSVVDGISTTRIVESLIHNAPEATIVPSQPNGPSGGEKPVDGSRLRHDTTADRPHSLQK
jgi:D-beta-D-heptose 7-phosphate kinase / D-beta-D-heptose 1-phosphate adenosyltransferase